MHVAAVVLPAVFACAVVRTDCKGVEDNMHPAIEEIRYEGMTLREMLMKLDEWV